MRRSRSGTILRNCCQQHFRLIRKGVLDSDVLADVEQGMHWVRQQPVYLQQWKHWAGNTYSGEFRSYMDELIRDDERRY